MCLVRPGEVHQLRPVPALEPFETFWWHVTAGGVNLSLAGFAGDRHVARGGFVPLVSSPVPDLARVVQELEGDRPHRSLLVRAALLELAALMLRHLDEAAARPAAPFTAERKGAWHVQRVAQHVELNHGADVSLRGLAHFAGLSPYYLTRLFARYTGRGVMTFLGDVRHREALSLLRNTDLAVAEVARSVGYDDPYYFSPSSARAKGRPPSTTGAASAPWSARTPMTTESILSARPAIPSRGAQRIMSAARRSMTGLGAAQNGFSPQSAAAKRRCAGGAPPSAGAGHGSTSHEREHEFAEAGGRGSWEPGGEPPRAPPLRRRQAAAQDSRRKRWGPAGIRTR